MQKSTVLSQVEDIGLTPEQSTQLDEVLAKYPEELTDDDLQAIDGQLQELELAAITRAQLLDDAVDVVEQYQDDLTDNYQNTAVKMITVMRDAAKKVDEINSVVE